MTFSPSARLKRYLVIGVSVYIFEVLVILAAQSLGAGPTLAVGLSFWLGLLLSFALQKFVTFGDKRTHHKVLIPQLAAFSTLVLFNFGFTLFVTNLLSPPFPPTLTRTLALGVTTLWNFYLYRTHLFRPSDDEPVVY